jgi:hypothetical protein
MKGYHILTNVLRTCLIVACAATGVSVATPAFAQNANTVKVVSGNNQMVERSGNAVPGGTATFGPLTVLVTNAAGKPVSGVTVNFTCTPSNPQLACQLNPGGGGGAAATSNAQGLAVLNQMGGNSVSVYYGGGAVTINATGNSFAGTAFTLTALTPTPAPVAAVTNPTLTITGGNSQSHERAGSAVAGGVANFSPLTVQLKNGAGQPVAGVPVTFTCHVPGAWACQTDPSGASHGVMQMTTNSSGIATLNGMGGNALSIYYGDGAFTVTASFQTASATFSETVGAGTSFAYTTTIVSGNNQTAQRKGSSVPGGTATFGPLVVLVTDAGGKPASGVTVDWTCSAPGQMACQLSPGGGGGVPSTSDSNGHATLNQMGGNSVSTYYATGVATINVSGSSSKPVSFTLTTTDPPPTTVSYVTGAKLSIGSGNSQRVGRSGSNVPGGTASFGALSVLLAGPTGTPIANAPITFVCHVPGAWACQFDPSGADHGTYTVTTGSNGIATLNRMAGESMSLYYGSGAFTVTASYGSVANTTFNEDISQ